MEDYSSSYQWKKFSKILPIEEEEELTISLEKTYGDPDNFYPQDELAYNVVVSTEKLSGQVNYEIVEGDDDIVSVNLQPLREEGLTIYSMTVTALKPGHVKLKVYPVSDTSIYTELELTVKENKIIPSFRIDDFTISLGQQNEIPVNITIDGETKDFNYNGFQFDIELPEGVSVADVAVNPAMTGFKVFINEIGGNVTRIQLIDNENLSSSSILENPITLKIKAGEGVKPAENATCHITKGVFFVNDTQNEEIKCEDSVFSVTVLNSLSFEIEDAEINIGQEIEIHVNIAFAQEKDFNYNGFQFDIELPEGVSVAEVTVNPAMTGFKAFSNEIGGNVTRIQVIDNENLSSTSVLEKVVTLKIQAGSNATPAENATCHITKGLFFIKGTQNEEMKCIDSEFNLTIINVPLTPEDVTITPATREDNDNLPEGDENKREGNEIYVDETLVYSAMVDDKVSNPDVKWTLSSGNEFISLTDKGNNQVEVKGLKFGEGTVRVTSEAYPEFSVEYTVKVIPMPIKSVTITAPAEIDLNELHVGDNVQLNVTVDPSEKYTGEIGVDWSSSAIEIATIGNDSDKGLLKAMQIGNATISATVSHSSEIGKSRYKASKTATAGIEVKPVMPQSVTITTLSLEGKEDKTDLKATEWLYLTAEVSPSGSTYKEIEWSVSHDDHIDIEIHPEDNGEGTMIIAKVRDNVVQDNVTITAKVKETQVSGSVTVNIAELFPGDADDDLAVDVADVITTAHWIVENRTESFCFVNADIDADKSIDVGDLTQTVDIALQKSANAKQVSRSLNGSLSSNSLYVKARNKGTRTEIDVMLKGGNLYKALQADLILPAGIDVNDILPGDIVTGHQLLYNLTEEGVLKAVLFSVDNNPFASTDGCLFTIIANGSNRNLPSLDIQDIITIDTNSEKHFLEFEGASIADEAGIDSIGTETLNIRGGEGCIDIAAPYPVIVDIFTVDGMHISHIDSTETEVKILLPKGIYIVAVNGKSYKTTVK